MEMRFGRLFDTVVVWIGVPTLLAVAALLISVDQFRFAEALLLLSGIWIIGWIIFLPYNKFPIDNKTETSLWAAIFGVFVVVSVLLHVVEEFRIKRILEANNGLLLPADEIGPVPCDLGGDHRVLILGSTPVATTFFPHDIIRVYDSLTQQDITLLSLDIINGSLAVSAYISSSDDRTISALENNHWRVNQNNILSKENPDVSSLVVYDQYNKRVLDVRFINKKLIRIYLLLRYHGHEIEFNEIGAFIGRHGPNDRPNFSNFCVVLDNQAAFIEVR